jgi:glycosyltransferase involved in cell wall biosynthesis
VESNRGPIQDGFGGMTQRPSRLLLISTHPVQYAAPIFRVLARDPRVEIQVVYCSMEGIDPKIDPGFGVRVQWDVPLLDGYPWTRLRSCSRKDEIGSFWGVFNPGMWRLISRANFDAVVLYTGYICATFWIALAAAKCNRVRVLFGTDAYDLSPRDGKKWKVCAKRWLWPLLFRLADQVIIVSSGGAALMRSLGIPVDRITLTPFCVDNERWISMSNHVDRNAVRNGWDIASSAAVILFCAKLQQWKRPQDLLRALAKIVDLDVYLVFAGDGPLLDDLKCEAKALGVEDRVRFLGFINQSALPEVYTAADIFVLPSQYEPFGLVVNEAMLCRCPVIVSDRVGARFDLVREGETGHVFPVGNIDALAAVLRSALQDRRRLCKMGEAARVRMTTWSTGDYVNALVGAVLKAGIRD